MAVMLKRISMVVLLSSMLVSGQAEATVGTSTSKVLPSLSGKLQKLRSNMRKVFESEYALLSTGIVMSCSFMGVCIASILGNPEISSVSIGVTGISFSLLSHSIFANQRRLQREAYDRGAKDVMDQLATKIKGAHSSDVLQSLEPVEVNDWASLSNSMLERVYMNDISDLFGVLQRINALIDEQGGFPLTVASDGLTFNNGVFMSYEELFGEGNYYRRGVLETEETPVVADN